MAPACACWCCPADRRLRSQARSQRSTRPTSRGRSCGRTVEFLDLYPTAAALAGLTGAPRNLHGTSLGPLLDNPAAPWNRPAITQVRRGSANSGFVHGYSIRTERYRYNMWAEGREGEELYDYDADAREMKNLAKDEREQPVKSQLRARLDGILAARRTSRADGRE